MASRFKPVTDQVQQMGSWDPGSASDLHETISTLSGVSDSVGGMYRQVAETLREHGVHTGFADVLEEAAGKVGHESDHLKGKLDKGLMNRADGATSDRVQGVADELRDLGSWEPAGPDDLHDTIQDLSGVLDSVGASYDRIGETVGQTGAHESYPPALHESAQALSAIGDEVENAFAGGVMTPPR